MAITKTRLMTLAGLLREQNESPKEVTEKEEESDSSLSEAYEDDEIDDVYSRPGHVKKGGSLTHVGGDPTNSIDFTQGMETIDPEDEGLSVRDEEDSWDIEYDDDVSNPGFRRKRRKPAWPDVRQG